MRIRAHSLLLLVLFFVAPTWQVKSELFKTCDQSGFCHRNRHFALQVAAQSNYIPKYAVSLFEIDEPRAAITGVVEKSLNDATTVRLPFRVQLLSDNNVRLLIDEEARSNGTVTVKDGKKINTLRYNEAAKWAFRDEPQAGIFSEPVAVASDEKSLRFSYGDGEFTAELQFTPFKLTILHGDSPQIVLNDRNFLNVEHWRAQTPSEPIEGEEPLDNNVSAEETMYDAFTDSFRDCKSDTVPLGPESVALDVSLPGFKHVYGIPEHADDLSLKDTTAGEPYRMFNVDIFEYEIDSRMAMYGSVPFMMAVKPGMAAGVFWVNSADTWVDIKKEAEMKAGDQTAFNLQVSTKTHWISENGVIDVVLSIGKTPTDVSKSYGALTGFVELPQLFALGYHQCRWNYNDEADVLGVSANMDKYQIPYDIIWLDIEYTDSKKYFTWKKELFPDPVGMMRQLDRTGRKLVTIIDPHIKVGYEVSDHLIKNNLAVQSSSADGSAFHGHCWPGESVWVDTLNPATDEYWSTLFANGTQFSGDATNLHIWNDMNEPSVFSGPETTSPKDTVHYGGWEARSIHNLYGMTYHESTFKAMQNRSGGRNRPFILTRSYFAGSQRSAAMWTGDNMSQWEHLKASLPMILTSGVVGMPFSGADVGGFFGNPSKELLTRWYQAGIWYPFFRAHAHIDSRRREPWIAGEPYTSIIRDAVRFRYSLLPMFYTSFYDANTQGVPVMKPMFYETPENPMTYEIEDQFFLGNTGLLIKPITEEGATATEIYLPDEQVYYSYDKYTVFKGEGYHKYGALLEQIPVLLKGGSILARKDRYRRSSALMRYDPYTLVVALDTAGGASGTLYVDDGQSYDYKQSDYIVVNFTATEEGIQAQVENSGLKLPFIASLDSVKIQKIILVGSALAQKAVSVSQSGETWDASVVSAANHVVIKSPGISINKPWNVTF
ncbi:glycoside hydrolase family 31 protein [Babjeviella inositovora NRRL Y-12698]|uniref:Glucosidase II subunit alpha n=1 Tax=Babjeviella inositovora NRRL Y-12698 TaxID=984486 RepID=A0A1E3QPG8_9ASCO|nr:glycoside hydrolase family 31 protein [Babjeviella inositovora NRRL Y-12698]ODQ79354.1 glycoside hydrolase family 31 protein [Babjeviella inositovora NRRL Y-12698]